MRKLSLPDEWTIARTLPAAVVVVTIAFYCCSGLVANSLRSNHTSLARALDVMALFGLGAAAVSGVVLWSSGMRWIWKNVWLAVLLRLLAVALHLTVIIALWALPYRLTFGGSHFYVPWYYEIQFAIGLVILIAGIVWCFKKVSS